MALIKYGIAKGLSHEVDYESKLNRAERMFQVEFSLKKEQMDRNRDFLNDLFVVPENLDPYNSGQISDHIMNVAVPGMNDVVAKYGQNYQMNPNAMAEIASLKSGIVNHTGVANSAHLRQQATRLAEMQASGQISLKDMNSEMAKVKEMGANGNWIGKDGESYSEYNMTAIGLKAQHELLTQTAMEEFKPGLIQTTNNDGTVSNVTAYSPEQMAGLDQYYNLHPEIAEHTMNTSSYTAEQAKRIWLNQMKSKAYQVGPDTSDIAGNFALKKAGLNIQMINARANLKRAEAANKAADKKSATDALNIMKFQFEKLKAAESSAIKQQELKADLTNYDMNAIANGGDGKFVVTNKDRKYEIDSSILKNGGMLGNPIGDLGFGTPSKNPLIDSDGTIDYTSVWYNIPSAKLTQFAETMEYSKKKEFTDFKKFIKTMEVDENGMVKFEINYPSLNPQDYYTLSAASANRAYQKTIDSTVYAPR